MVDSLRRSVNAVVWRCDYLGVLFWSQPMKTPRTLVLAGVLLAFVTEVAAQYIWTGIGNGWKNQVAPPVDGTADLILGESVHQTIPVFGTVDIDSLVALDDESFQYVAPFGPATFIVRTGALISGFGIVDVASNITLDVTGTPAFDAGNGRFIMRGQVVGAATNLTLVSSGTGAGNINFANTGAGNTYTGTTTIVGTPTSPLSVSFWNSAPFGTSQVNLLGASTLIAHGFSRTISNNFTINSVDPIAFRAWDDVVTYSGSLTLAGSSAHILQALTAPNGVASPIQLGTLPTPGPNHRNPIKFTGNIGESAAGKILQIGGPGIIILAPTSGSNTYTGGTIVNGSAIFGNAGAIPATGTITVNGSGGANGYAGTPDVTPGNFANFLTRINSSSAGAVGVDTLPGNPTSVLADNVSLASFGNTAIRLGTATSAILTGTITPQGANYQFGNGGGQLYIQSNLPNVSTVSSVVLDSTLNNGLVSPLKLYLQGSVSYTGGTIANDGFIIFETPTLPNTGALTAAGSSLNVGTSYIGFAQGVDEALSDFVNAFDKTNTWGIVGFDTQTGDLTPAVFTDPINLAGFKNGVFIGTASNATLTGTITPTDGVNADNAADTYRFTAGNGGRLVVMSQLTGARSVMIGSPSNAAAYSDGVVSLQSNTNDYTGGTIVNAGGPITLEVNGTSPLGTGPLTFSTTGGNVVGLQAAVGGYVFNSDIIFQVPGVNQGPTRLNLNGTNGFEVAGDISGPGVINVVNETGTSFTLSGNNSAWSGGIYLGDGRVVLASNNAAGTGPLVFGNPGNSVEFAAPTPTLYGISGDWGDLIVPNGVVLTFDTTNGDVDQDFGGVISRNGDGGTSSASLVVTAGGSSSEALYLHGQNLYSGGTTITGNGVLALGHNQAAGTGSITLGTPSGGLAVNTGVVLTNDLQFTAGTLMGLGTIDPAGMSLMTISTGKAVAPGLPGIAGIPVGDLTLDVDMEFANGGAFVWGLQDIDNSLEGYSELLIGGNLNISAAAGGFTLRLLSFDPNGETGFANVVMGQSYSLEILRTTGSITGFDPNAFTIDTSSFQAGTLNPALFSVALSGTDKIMLNFTAVPEPSTWALMILGAAFVGVTAWRRRRA